MTKDRLRDSPKWQYWLLITFGVQFFVILLYPALVCGCHFHPIAVPVSLVPAAWNAFSLFTAHTSGERILAYINSALAAGWLYTEWEANTQFAFP
ncbi:MAG: hypothetical protein V4710_02410 [Verrucomicrobiota bacterium]